MVTHLTQSRGRWRDSDCTEKIDYASWTTATHHSRNLDRKNREANDPNRTHVYRCPFCGGIHIGALPSYMRKRQP